MAYRLHRRKRLGYRKAATRLPFAFPGRVGYIDGMTDAPEAKPRWYRLTPDRLVIGLLAAEGFLLLSERFRWFAFNQHKGWTVLIDVATVGLTLLVMLLWFTAALLFRCRFQYSLRSLMLLVLAVAIACSWFATRMQRARKLGEAMEAIKKLGGQTWYSYSDPFADDPPDPLWLRNLFGDGFLGSGICVYLTTDAAIERLKELPELESLDLYGSRISDGGLRRVKELTQLKELSLDGTRVTDAELAYLTGLNGLRALVLRDTGITDAGLEYLEAIPTLERLNLAGTDVTDRGLMHLKRLTHLRWLSVDSTGVTTDGMNDLQQALPNCELGSG